MPTINNAFTARFQVELESYTYPFPTFKFSVVASRSSLSVPNLIWLKATIYNPARERHNLQFSKFILAVPDGASSLYK